MSDQGALSDGRENDFGLIETLLWTRDEGFGLLAEHLARLAASSAALGFAHDEARVRDALNAAVAGASNGRLRVRLVLARDGTIETSVTPIEPIPLDTVWRVAVAKRRFSSADPLLRHKTTRRALYEDALTDAAQRLRASGRCFADPAAVLRPAARHAARGAHRARARPRVDSAARRYFAIRVFPRQFGARSRSRAARRLTD
ncbi:MAG: aminotransferase class IV [Methylocystaceae bacterium]|nr:MAG: aminotransferase class IV [Methylocystaceae bacterium]